MKGKIFLSVLIGFVLGILTFFLMLLILPSYALLLALLIFAAASLVIHIVLVVEEKRSDKRYAKLEQNITSPVFFKVNGNFTIGKLFVNGNVYFCEQGILLLSIEKKPCLYEEIQGKDILKCEFDELRMHLYTKDGREFHIMTPEAPEAEQAIQGKYGL